MGIRKQFGLLFFVGGVGLIGYQVCLWILNGAWIPYPMSNLVLETIHALGRTLENIPRTSSESVDTFTNFKLSNFPFYVRRFLEIVPASGFLLLLGNFFVRWEKYVGLGLRTS